jgi:hypothetical protein
MNEVGFGVLPGYLKTADLEELRQFVETAVEAAGGEYVTFTGAERAAGDHPHKTAKNQRNYTSAFFRTSCTSRKYS